FAPRSRPRCAPSRAAMLASRSPPAGPGEGSVDPSDRLHLRLGAEGERRAAAYLEARGWRILARNVRVDRVELDLVARRGRTVAFVEVKTRRTRGAGAPEEAVDARKRARLARGAAAWLAAHGRPGLLARLDVIACDWS